LTLDISCASPEIEMKNSAETERIITFFMILKFIKDRTNIIPNYVIPGKWLFFKGFLTIFYSCKTSGI
jgi:hypothetical protein